VRGFAYACLAHAAEGVRRVRRAAQRLFGVGRRRQDLLAAGAGD
jgi:hypothetical protein